MWIIHVVLQDVLIIYKVGINPTEKYKYNQTLLFFLQQKHLITFFSLFFSYIYIKKREQNICIELYICYHGLTWTYSTATHLCSKETWGHSHLHHLDSRLFNQFPNKQNLNPPIFQNLYKLISNKSISLNITSLASWANWYLQIPIT